MPSERGRWMAIDWGERRIGLALSDPSGTIASPAGVVVRRVGKRPPIAELVRRAEALEARGIVVGLPLDGEGEDTPRATECRRVAAELARRTRLPVALLDERYTTAVALRAVHEMGGRRRGREGDVDALAATVLLQQALKIAELPAVDTESAPDGGDAAGA
ncbi:MAG TPA: Holliday junction resolvase RuvX [Gemmatimonadaceae bacterium]|jgi:putative Holliday junction resolvase|nr:Holliday junction resolvase RuvX [Gemmatimonadaceae bacterium]